jgi:hypothetical protein
MGNSNSAPVNKNAPYMGYVSTYTQNTSSGDAKQYLFA